MINQFHPLVRFVSERLRDIGEHFYPVVSIKVPKTFCEPSVPSGDYVFCVKRWCFEGIKSEELLQIHPRCKQIAITFWQMTLPIMLVNIARLHGEDWLDAPTLVDGKSVERQLDHFT